MSEIETRMLREWSGYEPVHILLILIAASSTPRDKGY